jgi:hypothetical protein
VSAAHPVGVEDLWHRYAACWSLGEDARAAELAECLAGDVSYCDPHSEVDGAEDLSAYMTAFQRDVPGGRFEIVEVLHHHGRSLARWRLRGGDGVLLQTGTSTATHADDRRLQMITGFFDDPPQTGGAEPGVGPRGAEA